MNILSQIYNQRTVLENVIHATLRPCWVGGAKYGTLYDVVVDGETIASRSHDPEHDACRALLAQGITGRLTLVGVDGTLRSSIDIERGAEQTVIEDEVRGLLLVPYRKWPGLAAVAPVSGETAPAPPTLPDDTNAADNGNSYKKERQGRERWESSDRYRHVLLRIDAEWRIIGCKDDLQWILQRRSGAAWKSSGHVRSREGLEVLLRRNRLPPSLVRDFPSMYRGGERR